MKFLKKNFKLIVGIIIGAILISGISVYATTTYLASQVTYKDGKTVEQALNNLYEIYDELQNNSLADIENVELISKGLDGNITIPAGFRYVIITNVYFGAHSGKKEEYIEKAKLLSYTNSTIIKQESSGKEYTYASDGVWLIVAKINDTTLTSNFEFNSEPNIVFGIK